MELTTSQKAAVTAVILAAAGILTTLKDCSDQSPTPAVSPSVVASTSPSPTASPAISPVPIPSVSPSPTVSPSGSPVAGLTIWANDGGEKIPRDDTGRAHTSLVWDGAKVTLHAARNEVVSFQLIVEAQQQTTVSAPTVTVDPAIQQSVFTAKYVQIKGLSMFSYNPTYDERHVPMKFRRAGYSPTTGAASGGWVNRPDHDKFYPDALVPIALLPQVTVPAGKSQSFWVDLFISKATPAGSYSGMAVTGGKPIPIALTVAALTLPDKPYAKAMVALSNDLTSRYGSSDQPLRDAHFRMMHEHRISLIDASLTGTAPPPQEWSDRMTGKTYATGPGAGVGQDALAVGLYGSWSWAKTQTVMTANSQAWSTWCKANAPQADCFLYVCDETLCSPTATIQQYASWVKTGGLLALATISPTAAASMPAVSPVTSWFQIAPPTWGPAIAALQAAGTQVWSYNGKRPLTPSFATEDDGVALRALPWAQIKKGIQRHFFWNATYYNDTQGGRGQTDVWNTAATFSYPITQDPSYGEYSGSHSNGDGMLVYPGTDKIFPASSLAYWGPIASIRLKQWRRGIEDMDLYSLASQMNKAKADTVLTRMVPKVYWDVGVDNPSDPTYVHTDISWSTNSDDWEQARRDLENIALGF